MKRLLVLIFCFIFWPFSYIASDRKQNTAYAGARGREALLILKNRHIEPQFAVNGNKYPDKSISYLGTTALSQKCKLRRNVTF